MKYEVKFKLANDEKVDSVDFTDKEFKKVIINAINNYNDAGATARNKKNIYNYNILRNIIILQFESEIELENPTKSFRFFSKDLIDKSDLFKELVVGGRLLKGIDARRIQSEAETDEDVVLSDEQMLTTLIHWCMTKQLQGIEEKKYKRKTIDKIKQLIIECDMLSYSNS